MVWNTATAEISVFSNDKPYKTTGERTVPWKQVFVATGVIISLRDRIERPVDNGWWHGTTRLNTGDGRDRWLHERPQRHTENRRDDDTARSQTAIQNNDRILKKTYRRVRTPKKKHTHTSRPKLVEWTREWRKNNTTTVVGGTGVVTGRSRTFLSHSQCYQHTHLRNQSVRVNQLFAPGTITNQSIYLSAANSKTYISRFAFMCFSKLKNYRQ